MSTARLTARTRNFLPMACLFAVLCWVFSAAPAAANDPFIKTAQDWLNGLETAQARFIQTAADGKQMTGNFYLRRPGRLRFEYDAPIEDFIVADGIFIYFYDGEMREMSNAPIGQTLADFILRASLDLGSDRSDLIVEETRHEKDIFRLILVQRDDPYAGKIILDFTKTPFALSQWMIVDAQGSTTEIRLIDLQRDMALAGALFRFVDPHEGKGGRFNN